MKWLALLPAALLCATAQAQGDPSPLPAPVIVHVYSDGGTPTFWIEGTPGGNGPVLGAGGALVVRTGDGLEARLIVEPGLNGGHPGTVGPNAVGARPGAPGALRAPSRRERSRPGTYHRVSVLACTAYAPLPDDASVYDTPDCAVWQALRQQSATEGPLGFVLEVSYGLGEYRLPAQDPPGAEPIDPRY